MAISTTAALLGGAVLGGTAAALSQKKPSAPPPPDYTGAAQLQGQANLEAARLQARLSNPNIAGPLGGQRVTFGRNVFDQTAYDKAMADYNKQLEAYNAARAAGQPYTPPTAPRTGLPGGGVIGGRFDQDDRVQPGLEDEEQMLSGRFPGAGFGLRFDPATGMPIAPTKEQFTTQVDLDTPFIEQYLNPEAEAAIKAQQRVQEQYARLGEKAFTQIAPQFETPFRPDLPDMATSISGYRQIGEAPGLATGFRTGFQREALPYAPDLGMYGLAAGGPAGLDLYTPTLGGGQGVAQGPAGGQFGMAGAGPAAPTQIVGANLAGVGGVGYGPREGQYGYAQGFVPAQQLQERLDLRGLTAMPTGAGMTAQQAILSRLSPELTQRRAALENQLANQGIPRGSEAYRQAMTELAQQENDLITQAALQGINVDAAMRAQGFQEAQSQAALLNQARQATFGMGTTQLGLYNQALQQNLAQGLSVQEAQNRAQAQDFQQRLAAGQFGREAQQLAFTMGQSAEEARNRSIAQNFAQAQAAQQAANAAQAQAFQQRAAEAEFVRSGQLGSFQTQQAAQEARNRAIAQNQAAAMQQFQAGMARQAQGFGQEMDLTGLYNQALSAQNQTALQQYQAEIAAQNQQFQQAQAAAAFANAARQQSFQEQAALRAQPLNEIAALMSGSQVQMPQFQGYQGASVAPTPVFAAQQAAAQFAQQNYANQVAAYNAQQGGLYGLAGAGLYGLAASDRRLKSNVIRIGTHPLGIGIYEYDIAGNRQRGVMADELEAVMPEAVYTRPDGYKMVNYGAIA